MIIIKLKSFNRTLGIRIEEEQMYRIVKAEQLADKIYLMDVEAPRVARSCQPGEFVIVKVDEAGERIPLTVCDYDRERGVVTIVFQIVGASTQKMAALQAGDSFRDFVGPLGRPSEFIREDLEVLKGKKMLFVAGGVGTAPVYPQVKWLRAHGIDADVVVGAKTKEGRGGESLHNHGRRVLRTKGSGDGCGERPGGEPGQKV